jgi:hypothetical protein
MFAAEASIRSLQRKRTGNHPRVRSVAIQQSLKSSYLSVPRFENRSSKGVVFEHSLCLKIDEEG